MIFSVTLPSDGTNADVQDYNDPIQQIIAGLNGQLNDDNISGLSGSKITSGTLPEAALTDALKTGWYTQSTLPTSIVALGNRSYTVTYGSSVAAYKSPGMRNRFTRNTAAPNQSASLNGTTQYFVKTSPNKMAWTDDFSIGVWVKLSSYPASAGMIASRFNGTSGFAMFVNSTGQIRLSGYNASASNESYVQSYQSIHLNEWVFISAQLDMSSFTATATTSYVMLDGLNVPAIVSRSGTNPTSLVQAGNLEIGSWNGGLLPFGGKIAQLGIYNAKVLQATFLASMNQGLTGSETNLASGYSLSNSVLDLNTTTPNDLSVGGGSATTTNADSPFGNSGVSTTVEYGITMAVASNGLSETIQVPEGCALPTTGSISAMSYCAVGGAPYGFPMQDEKWDIECLNLADNNSTANSTFNHNITLNLPVGSWGLEAQYDIAMSNGSTAPTGRIGVSTSSSAYTNRKLVAKLSNSTSNSTISVNMSVSDTVSVTTMTPYYTVSVSGNASTAQLIQNATNATASFIRARNAYL